jgi:hypothetical protein
MIYDYQDIALASAMVRILGIVLVVALIAYIVKGRSLFIGGTIGSFLGFLIAEPKCYSEYNSIEGAFIGGISDYSRHILNWGIIGSIIGMGVGAAVAMYLFPARSELSTPDKENNLNALDKNDL